MRTRISLFLKSCDGATRLIVFLDSDFCLNHLARPGGVFLVSLLFEENQDG